MFFSKKNKPITKSPKINFDQIDSIKLQSNNMSFNLNIKKHCLVYNNIMNPADGGLKFPDGYFDKKEINLTSKEIKQIKNTLYKLLLKINLRNEFLALPFGFRLKAYMKICCGKEEMYYSDCYGKIENLEYTIHNESIPKEYFDLIQQLKKYCNFPQYICQESVDVTFPEILEPDILEHIHCQFSLEQMEEIIGYHDAMTGVSFYDFYKDTELICSAMHIPHIKKFVRIYGDGETWECEFEHCTLQEGYTRNIINTSRGKTNFKILYQSCYKYVINDSVEVFTDKETYTFFCCNELIAQVKQCNEPPEHLNKRINAQYDTEEYLEAFILKGMDKSLLKIILNFPLLQ